MRRVLVVGFGPFLEVADNPAARLAREVHGLRIDRGLVVVGREMPVSYARAPALCARWAEELDAAAILGVGVARGRDAAWIERRGAREADATLTDIDDERLSVLDPTGPAARDLVHAEAVAAALGVGVSEDAGRYVCNAWIYRMAHLGRPVAFLHVPPAGFPAERLGAGLLALVG